MIITRSPLRISLGGGGTDLPSYYREHGGFLIAGAIDRYVYVNVMRPFTQGIFLKYSKLEHTSRIDGVQHPIIREALKMLEFKTPQVEITTLADIPAGKTVVSESGLREREQLAELERVGVDAVLIGESLIASDDPAIALEQLTGGHDADVS